jgi:hypothetical protein
LPRSTADLPPLVKKHVPWLHQTMKKSKLDLKHLAEIKQLGLHLEQQGTSMTPQKTR